MMISCFLWRDMEQMFISILVVLMMSWNSLAQQFDSVIYID